MQDFQPDRRRKKLRIIYCAIALGGLALVFFLGPRVSIRDVRAGGPIDLAVEAGDLDRYLETSERAFEKDLVPETRKQIFWHGQAGQRTSVSVVFLHGFSGSHMTMAPFPEKLARRLNANLYCTRYAGHGRKNPDGYAEAMAEATPQKWIDDTREALAIGRKIGGKVVVLANSTAAPLATWLAGKGHAPDVLVFLSPNFGVRNPFSETLLWPWGPQILKLTRKESNSYKEENIASEDHRRYASTSYPSSALLTMMAAVKLGRTAAHEKITAPILCLYSERDEVVSPDATRKTFSKLTNTDKRMEEVRTVTHMEHHVLAGRILSPDSTPEVIEKIINFLRTQGITPSPRHGATNLGTKRPGA